MLFTPPPYLKLSPYVERVIVSPSPSACTAVPSRALNAKPLWCLNFISWLVDGTPDPGISIHNNATWMQNAWGLAKMRAQRGWIFAKTPVVLQQASKCRQIHAFKTLNPSSIEYYQANKERTSASTTSLQQPEECNHSDSVWRKNSWQASSVQWRAGFTILCWW